MGFAPVLRTGPADFVVRTGSKTKASGMPQTLTRPSMPPCRSLRGARSLSGNACAGGVQVPETRQHRAVCARGWAMPRTPCGGAGGAGGMALRYDVMLPLAERCTWPCVRRRSAWSRTEARAAGGGRDGPTACWLAYNCATAGDLHMRTSVSPPSTPTGVTRKSYLRIQRSGGIGSEWVQDVTHDGDIEANPGPSAQQTAQCSPWGTPALRRQCTAYAPYESGILHKPRHFWGGVSHEHGTVH